MILFRLFFFIVGFFFLMMMGLGVLVWLRLRLMGLHSVFKKQAPPSAYQDDKVIDGEYTVIEQEKEE